MPVNLHSALFSVCGTCLVLLVAWHGTQAAAQVQGQIFNCRSGGTGTADQCRQRDAQSPAGTPNAGQISNCRSGGTGTADQCRQRDAIAQTGAQSGTAQAPQCWLFPNGGTSPATANSTPPVAGARLGACPQGTISPSTSGAQGLTLQIGHPLKKPSSVNPEGAFYDRGYNNGVPEKDWRQHLGSDLHASGGDPVYAIKDGVVSCVNPGPSSWNKAVILLHSDGSKTVYGHVDASVSQGSSVKAGARIGSVLYSSSSELFAAHLHFGENVRGNVNCGTVSGVGGTWGWGRAPYVSSRQDAISAGWIDPVQKYGF